MHQDCSHFATVYFADRQTDRQTDRSTDRQTVQAKAPKHKCLHSLERQQHANYHAGCIIKFGRSFEVIQSTKQSIQNTMQM